MAKKQRNISWNPIIITAMVLVFLLVIIFGFNSNNYAYENSRFTKTSENSFGNDIQKISINGINQEKVLNYPNQEISLDLNGNYNTITITKETLIVEIDLNGIGNTLNLCKIHSPQIVQNGIDNDINYLDC